MGVEFELYLVDRGDPWGYGTCHMSMYDGLGDRVIRNSRLVRTGVHKLRPVGWIQSAASFHKTVLGCSHTCLFLFECFDTTVAKLNTAETAIAHKTLNIYSLALYRKSLLASELEDNYESSLRDWTWHELEVSNETFQKGRHDLAEDTSPAYLSKLYKGHICWKFPWSQKDTGCQQVLICPS